MDQIEICYSRFAVIGIAIQCINSPQPENDWGRKPIEPSLADGKSYLDSLDPSGFDSQLTSDEDIKQAFEILSQTNAVFLEKDVLSPNLC